MFDVKIRIPSDNLEATMNLKDVASLLIKDIDLTKNTKEDLDDTIQFVLEDFPNSITCKTFLNDKFIKNYYISLPSNYDILKGSRIYEEILLSISAYIDRDFKCLLISKIIENKNIIVKNLSNKEEN